MASLEALGINLPSLLWHTFNFLLLLALLTRFLYRPVVGMLDERAARIKDSMERAEEIRQQLAKTQEETRRQLEAARRESQSILDQANQIAERMKAQARQDAQAEADKIVARARLQLEHEREQTLVELRRQTADLVVAAAAKVIGRSLDGRAQHQLVEEFLSGDPPKLND